MKSSRPNAKYRNVVGTRVRLARLAANPPISQDDLSGRLARLGIQITQTGISKIENRTRYLMDFEVSGLAEALRVTVAWLYGEEDESKAKH